MHILLGASHGQKADERQFVTPTKGWAKVYAAGPYQKLRTPIVFSL
jgi:hypothetical protein